MNWPSYWEDIRERAAASPPPKRSKLAWKSAISAQRVEFGPGGPGPSHRTRGPSQADREAALYVQRVLEAKDRAIEARTRAYAADLCAWQNEIKDVEPLRRP
jgi:hypothetical protein